MLIYVCLPDHNTTIISELCAITSVCAVEHVVDAMVMHLPNGWVVVMVRWQCVSSDQADVCCFLHLPCGWAI